LLDYVDGNLARLHGITGNFGARLEELADQVGPSLFPLAVGIGLYFRPDRLMGLFGGVDPVWAVLVGALTSMAYCLGTMALLYFRLTPPNASRGDSNAAPQPASEPPSAFASKIMYLSKALVNEAVYLATVVGVVLAAVLNFMGIYLIARCVRNLAFLLLRIGKLVARLSGPSE
jgi:phosphatidylglycerophosphate synthase